MEIFIAGIDVTKYCDVERCVHRDQVGKADVCEFLFRNGADWQRWQIEPDTEIRVFRDGYSTGILYVASAETKGTKYEILACSVPMRARKERSTAFENRTFGMIAEYCAAECGMKAKIFGIDRNIRYQYLQTEYETPCATLEKLCAKEGGTLKVVDGALCCIGHEWAAKMPPQQVIKITNGDGARHVIRSGSLWKTATCETPYVKASYTDNGISGGIQKRLEGIAPADEAEGARWCRNLLEKHNRECETLRIATGFNAGATALARIEIGGETDGNGIWNVDEVKQDFVNGKSEIVMVK